MYIIICIIISIAIHVFFSGQSQQNVVESNPSRVADPHHGPTTPGTQRAKDNPMLLR